MCSNDCVRHQLPPDVRNRSALPHSKAVVSPVRATNTPLSWPRSKSPRAVIAKDPSDPDDGPNNGPP